MEFLGFEAFSSNKCEFFLGWMELHSCETGGWGPSYFIHKYILLCTFQNGLEKWISDYGNDMSPLVTFCASTELMLRNTARSVQLTIVLT